MHFLLGPGLARPGSGYLIAHRCSGPRSAAASRPATAGSPPRNELALLEAEANPFVAVLVRIGFELIQFDLHVHFLTLAVAKRLERADEPGEGLRGDQVWAIAVEIQVAEGRIPVCKTT